LFSVFKKIPIGFCHTAAKCRFDLGCLSRRGVDLLSRLLHFVPSCVRSHVWRRRNNGQCSCDGVASLSAARQRYQPLTTALPGRLVSTRSPSALTRDRNYIASIDNDDDDNALTHPTVYLFRPPHFPISDSLVVPGRMSRLIWSMRRSCCVRLKVN